jgi:tagatose-1,6-bisphosphate aldolase
MPLQLLRYVLLDAGQSLQACAEQIHTPYVYLKAPVEPEVLRAALQTR